MAQGCVRAGVAAARGDGPAGVSGFVSSIRARPGGGWAGYRRRPRAGAARARQEEGRSQAAGPRSGAEAEAACRGRLRPNRGIEPSRSRPGIFAHFTPCTPLPVRCRGGAAPDRRPGGVAQDREFAQLSAQGKPISSDVDSLSAVMIPKPKNHSSTIFAIFQTNASKKSSYLQVHGRYEPNSIAVSTPKTNRNRLNSHRSAATADPERGRTPPRQRQRPKTSRLGCC